MAGTKITLGFGLMSVNCKRDVAVTTKPTLSNMCVGQPGKPTHEASPVRRPAVCTVCGPITDESVFVKGVASGKTYTVIDSDAANEAKNDYAKAYLGTLSLVPHPAQEFMLSTGEGKALHYLTPADQSSENFYALLAKLIADHPEVVFVGLFTPRSATCLFYLTVREGVIVMAERTRTTALKPLPSVGGVVNEKLYAALEGMLEEGVEPYAPDAYEDRYAAALASLLDEGTVLAVDETTKTPAKAMTEDELLTKLTLLKSASKTTTKKKAKASA